MLELMLAPCFLIVKGGVNWITRSDEETIDATIQNTPVTIEEYDDAKLCPHKN